MIFDCMWSPDLKKETDPCPYTFTFTQICVQKALNSPLKCCERVNAGCMDCFNLFSTLYWQTFEKGLEQISGELAEPTQAIRGHKGISIVFILVFVFVIVCCICF